MLNPCAPSLVSRTPSRPVPVEIVENALRKATAWATERCYIPCSYEMCGAITEYTEKRVSVYVRFVPSSPDSWAVGPEAEVMLSLPSYTVAGETLWHSGCRWRSPDCEWASRKRGDSINSLTQ